MTAKLQTLKSSTISFIKISQFLYFFMEAHFLGRDWWESIIDLGDALAPNRRQNMI